MRLAREADSFLAVSHAPRPQLSQIEHILKRPDSYIGSVQHITQTMWVFDYENKKMVNRCVKVLLAVSSSGGRRRLTAVSRCARSLVS